jgi:hypothetical protein
MWCPNQVCPDAQEQGSPAEFVEGKTDCTFCGAALVPDKPAWSEPDDEIRLAPVMSILDAAWLPRVKTILDEAGVTFKLENDAAAPPGSARSRPVVMVEEKDLEQATALLADFQDEVGMRPDEARPPEPPAWQPATCPQCGKALDTGEGDEPLAYCYHCGASLSPESAER